MDSHLDLVDETDRLCTLGCGVSINLDFGVFGGKRKPIARYKPLAYWFLGDMKTSCTLNSEEYFLLRVDTRLHVSMLLSHILLQGRTLGRVTS